MTEIDQDTAMQLYTAAIVGSPYLAVELERTRRRPPGRPAIPSRPAKRSRESQEGELAVSEVDRDNEAGGMPPPLYGIARAARLELAMRRVVREVRERRQAGGPLEPRDRDASAALELAERFEKDGRI